MNNKLVFCLAIGSLFLCTSLAFSQIQVSGNPQYQGRLELVYPDDSTMAQVDGEYLNSTTNGKVVQEYDNGKHSFKVYARKGLFDADLKQDTTIDIPGGYIVRATIKNNLLVILDTVPIPGLIPATTVPVATQKSPQTKNVTSKTQIGVGGVTMEVTTSNSFSEPSNTTPAPAKTTAPAAIQNSKIQFLSDTGQCEVYLDGKKVADLGISGMDQPAKASVFDLKPSTYKIKITSFNDTWYNGKITIGNGEQIKIQIDPKVFDIISRDPIR